jgi:hypothetical protein
MIPASKKGGIHANWHPIVPIFFKHSNPELYINNACMRTHTRKRFALPSKPARSELPNRFLVPHRLATESGTSLNSDAWMYKQLSRPSLGRSEQTFDGSHTVPKTLMGLTLYVIAPSAKLKIGSARALEELPREEDWCSAPNPNASIRRNHIYSQRCEMGRPNKRPFGGFSGFRFSSWENFLQDNVVFRHLPQHTV